METFSVWVLSFSHSINQTWIHKEMHQFSTWEAHADNPGKTHWRLTCCEHFSFPGWISILSYCQSAVIFPKSEQCCISAAPRCCCCDIVTWWIAPKSVLPCAIKQRLPVAAVINPLWQPKIEIGWGELLLFSRLINSLVDGGMAWHTCRNTLAHFGWRWEACPMLVFASEQLLLQLSSHLSSLKTCDPVWINSQSSALERGCCNFSPKLIVEEIEVCYETETRKFTWWGTTGELTCSSSESAHVPQRQTESGVSQNELQLFSEKC